MPRQRTHTATGAPPIQKERAGSWWQTMEKKFRMARLRSGEFASSGAAMAKAARASGMSGMATRAAVPLRADNRFLVAALLGMTRGVGVTVGNLFLTAGC